MDSMREMVTDICWQPSMTTKYVLQGFLSLTSMYVSAPRVTIFLCPRLFQKREAVAQPFFPSIQQVLNTVAILPLVICSGWNYSHGGYGRGRWQSTYLRSRTSLHDGALLSLSVTMQDDEGKQASLPCSEHRRRGTNLMGSRKRNPQEMGGEERDERQILPIVPNRQQEKEEGCEQWNSPVQSTGCKSLSIIRTELRHTEFPMVCSFCLKNWMDFPESIFH